MRFNAIAITTALLTQLAVADTASAGSTVLRTTDGGALEARIINDSKGMGVASPWDMGDTLHFTYVEGDGTMHAGKLAVGSGILGAVAPSLAQDPVTGDIVLAHHGDGGLCLRDWLGQEFGPARPQLHVSPTPGTSLGMAVDSRSNRLMAWYRSLPEAGVVLQRGELGLDGAGSSQDGFHVDLGTLAEAMRPMASPMQRPSGVAHVVLDVNDEAYLLLHDAESGRLGLVKLFLDVLDDRGAHWIPVPVTLAPVGGPTTTHGTGGSDTMPSENSVPGYVLEPYQLSLGDWHAVYWFENGVGRGFALSASRSTELVIEEDLDEDALGHVGMVTSLRRAIVDATGVVAVPGARSSRQTTRRGF